MKNMDKKSLVDQIEKSLVELLSSKEYSVGAVIPKELELSTQLGVSRTVVREALSRLRTRGMIESRKKRGAVVTSPDIVSVIEKGMNPDILDQNTLKEIFEMRLSLEVGMADFIIKRVTEQDIKELRAIVSKETPNKMPNLFAIDEEIAFHSKLYEICDNNTMKGFQKMLLPIFNYVHSSGMLNDMPVFKKVVTHSDLIDLIESRSADKLRKGIRQHLNGHFKRVF
ncbi:DNA-binding transcriptional regulator, FadR family [Arachidicoccus rhizosphaerae]|jgi:DNA-binding FadR family transcriptional regulator|uniref:DNA-binding transcriptional regulator, FadR family n=2 Tax=Arachidicoccus rhizosphaerae TaxID=551991 RepID=A0A1H3ZXL0_9BACT|nr:DNA-binding transcriptional regulator, FadR family [Arachidicoccus rhizosphaerae]